MIPQTTLLTALVQCTNLPSYESITLGCPQLNTYLIKIETLDKEIGKQFSVLYLEYIDMTLKVTEVSNQQYC